MADKILIQDCLFVTDNLKDMQDAAIKYHKKYCDTADEIGQLQKDNAALKACVSTAIKYQKANDPEAALKYLIGQLRLTTKD